MVELVNTCVQFLIVCVCSIHLLKVCSAISCTFLFFQAFCDVKLNSTACGQGKHYNGDAYWCYKQKCTAIIHLKVPFQLECWVASLISCS